MRPARGDCRTARVRASRRGDGAASVHKACHCGWRGGISGCRCGARGGVSRKMRLRRRNCARPSPVRKCVRNSEQTGARGRTRRRAAARALPKRTCSALARRWRRWRRWQRVRAALCVSVQAETARQTTTDNFVQHIKAHLRLRHTPASDGHSHISMHRHLNRHSDISMHRHLDRHSCMYANAKQVHAKLLHTQTLARVTKLYTRRCYIHTYTCTNTSKCNTGCVCVC